VEYGREYGMTLFKLREIVLTASTGALQLRGRSVIRTYPASSLSFRRISADKKFHAGILEDPAHPPPDDMWVMTDDPREAPNEPTDITIHFEKGIPTKLVTPRGEHTDSVDLFSTLNKIGKIHGIGRIDIVENRLIGLKSRGCCHSYSFKTVSVVAGVDSAFVTICSGLYIALETCMQNKARMSFDGYPFRLPLSKLPQLSPIRANKDPQMTRLP